MARACQALLATGWDGLLEGTANRHRRMAVRSPDLELVRVPPEPNPAYTWCQAHQNSGAAICNPYLQYRPRAHNRVFMPRGGREARVPVAGWSNAPDGQFCTSGWRTGVRCVWRGMSLGPGIAQPNYDHISAADGSEFVSLDGGDSGGPVVTYDMHLIGIISSSDERTRSILLHANVTGAARASRLHTCPDQHL